MTLFTLPYLNLANIALLQLHRRYFTQAMNSAEPFDMNQEFAPSVLATYLSASTLIATVDDLYEHEQNLSVRFLHFWFNVFSAAVSDATMSCKSNYLRFTLL